MTLRRNCGRKQLELVFWDMTRVEVKCPAAEIQHPVLSRNKDDAQCRINGHLQPAKGSPCCGEYTRCQIWRIHTEIERGPSTQSQRDQARSGPRPHVLEGVARESIVA